MQPDPTLDLGEDAARMERRAEADLDRVLKALRRGRRVAVGPWRGEVGYEVVFWIPFLRRLVHDHSIDPDQLVAVSRGGVRDWYAGIASSYVDIFDVISTDHYRGSLEAIWRELGGQKQPQLIPFERRLLRDAGAPLPSRRWRPGGTPVLHPSIMFGLFRRFWKGGQELSVALDRLRFERWPTPRDDDGLAERLPSRFVAARFYFNVCFPDTPANRAVVRSTVQALAKHTPVVLLNTGLVVDDHTEVEPLDDERILRPLVGVPASRNLGAQTFVISRADAFVGVVGGPAWFTPAYGVPSLAFGSELGNVFPSFVDVARRSALANGTPLMLVDTAQLENLALLAGRRAPAAVHGSAR